MLAEATAEKAQALPGPNHSARSIGTWFHLLSIGAVAGATIAVFFGTGFLLLLQQAQGSRQDGPVLAGDNAGGHAPAIAQPRRNAAPAPAAAPRSAPAARAAAFVRLSLPMAAPAETDAPRLSLPEHAAVEHVDLPAPGAARPAPPLQLAAHPPAPQPTAAPATNRAAAAAASSPPAANPAAAAGAARPEPQPAAAEIAGLRARGDALLRAGDVASARLFYERAADAGDRQAALREGATFDPAFLAKAGLRGTLGDPAKARWWYARALQPAPQAAR